MLERQNNVVLETRPTKRRRMELTSRASYDAQGVIIIQDDFPDIAIRDDSPTTIQGDSDNEVYTPDTETFRRLSITSSGNEDSSSGLYGFSKNDYVDDNNFANILLGLTPTSSGMSTPSMTDKPLPTFRKRKLKFDLRNPAIEEPWEELRSSAAGDMYLSANGNVELIDGTFLRIRKILRNNDTMDVFIRGWLFKRTSTDGFALDWNTNELVWITDIDEDDTRHYKDQCVIEVPVSDVLRRCTIRMTNEPWPTLDVLSNNKAMGKTDDVESSDKLVCRVRFLRRWKSATDRIVNAYAESGYLYLQAGEADRGFRRGDAAIRTNFRGDTIKGGSGLGMSMAEKDRNEKETASKHEAYNGHVNLDGDWSTSVSLHRESRPRAISIPSNDSDLEDVDDTEQIYVIGDGQEPDQLWMETRDVAKVQPAILIGKVFHGSASETVMRSTLQHSMHTG